MCVCVCVCVLDDLICFKGGMRGAKFLFHPVLQFSQFIHYVKYNADTMPSPIRMRKDTITGYFSLFQTLGIECGQMSSEHRASLATATLVLVIITADSLQGRWPNLSCSCSPCRPARLEQKLCRQGSVLVQVKAEYHPYQATKCTSVLERDI